MNYNLQQIFLDISKKIKDERLRRGISQSQAGDMIGISQSQYSKKEGLLKEQNFTIPEIFAICTELNIDFYEVIKKIEQPSADE